MPGSKDDAITIQPILLDARQAARLCGVSARHWATLYAGENTPAPLKLGARVLWRRAELEAWVAAGCPARRRWDAMIEAEAGQ